MEKENTGCPIILLMVLFPTASYSCTLMFSFATIPFVILLNVGSEEKGENAFSFVLIFERSDASLSILELVAFLWCLLVAYVRSLKSCTLTSDVMEADIVHNARCYLTATVLFSDLMSVCSATRSQLRPVQN